MNNEQPNPALDNQEIYCQINKLPLFANAKCWHCNKTLTEMLVKRYGNDQALIVASSKLITACPGCGRTWCD